MSEASLLSENSVITAAKEQVSSELVGEAVILNLKSGVYYGLNEVGNRTWNLIQKPKTVKGIKNTLLAEYEVEPESCEHDLMALLQDMAAAGLIDVRNETVA